MSDLHRVIFDLVEVEAIVSDDRGGSGDIKISWRKKDGSYSLSFIDTDMEEKKETLLTMIDAKDFARLESAIEMIREG